ncbi:MAG: sarcosine oxidase subunit gamma [Paracoccaceae bacterium]
MANHRLKPLTPLGHDAAEIVSIGPVTLTENTTSALASLASRLGREADVAKAAKAAAIALPGPGRCVFATPYGAFWLGPEQWMILAPFDTHEDITAHLKPLFGDAASLTEQTDAWVRFDLTAPNLARLFELLCALDTASMADNSATRSIIEHLGVYVLRQNATHFTVLGPRSSAASLHHALITAAKAAF